jgi:hypothetical protein
MTRSTIRAEPFSAILRCGSTSHFPEEGTMANENTTPIKAEQDTTKQGAGNPVNPQPMGEQKTAPAQPDKNEPVRK